MESNRSAPTESNISAVETATDLRQRGNFEFSNGRCDEAVAFYSAALQHCCIDSDLNNYDEATHRQICEERILNLCNRSACYSQQEEWELGRQDANEAWELSQHKSVKAAYRYAKCSVHLKDYDAAKSMIQTALRLLDDREILSTTSQQPGTSIPTSTTPAPDASKQRSALMELWNQTLTLTLNSSTTEKPETSIKYAKRPISIKEFTLLKQLGHGNFSEIYMVSHKVTNEQFALKKIEKKQAAELYKRQHPNVYNEIQMERRILLEKLSSPGHPYIVRMYHAFQDYNSLYYLMDLHVERTDLWSQLRYKNLPGYGETAATSGEKLVMMGCHRSTARLWLYELVAALEYMHSRGIVHRDLKTENILLSATGHVLVIDFGTAKDLLQTDLNGPEFVGTPDFMSPEAVTGTDKSGDSGIGQYALLSDNEAKKDVQAGPEADLWALGAIAFILQTGHTPYWSPSPYLAFLKIKRSISFQNLLRPTGIIEDNCWDLILQLMRGDPTKRIGAGSFVIDHNSGSRVMRCKPDGYDIIRQHPYFHEIHTELKDSKFRSKALPIPSLLDLCYRACAQMAYLDSKGYELCDKHPPGDGSKHDLTRLKLQERAGVLHCLDRRCLLAEPRVYSRFFTDPVAARLDKIRLSSRDVVGLTQMNDDQGKPPKALMHDQYAKPVEMDPITITVLTCPPYIIPDETNDQSVQKAWTKQLKKCIVSINRNRPNLVIVLGHVDDISRKIISKTSETIPIVMHDGSSFFTFWRMGVQCIALTAASNLQDEQMLWLKQHLEQVRLSKYPLFVFVATDPSDFPEFVLKKLTQGRTLCIFGLSKYESKDETVFYQSNEMVDNVSIRSTDSEEDDKDNFTTKIKSASTIGLYKISLDDEPDKWEVDFETIS